MNFRGRDPFGVQSATDDIGPRHFEQALNCQCENLCDWVYAALPRVEARMGQPIRVITVEREYGSRGAEFAHELAGRLGWRLLDDELLTRAARAAGVPETDRKSVV